MSQNQDTLSAPLTYLVKTGDKPYVHTAALTGGLPRYFATMEERQTPIHDGRPRAGELGPDREGFALLRHRSAVADFFDDAEVKSVYYPEMEKVLEVETGAREILIFDHTRRIDDDNSRGDNREPALRAHNDYTEQSAPERVRTLAPEDADRLLARPYAQYNIWRPIDGPVLRSPLALLDAESLDPEDLVATDQVYPDRVGEIYHLAYNPAQRWYYFPQMTPDEVVLIKGFDSRRDGRARFTPHTAFHHPATPPDAPPRQSIEIRAFVFWA